MDKRFQCSACGKTLSTKQRVTTHEEICKEMKKLSEKEKEENYFLELLKEKDKKIEELQKTIDYLTNLLNV